MRVLTTGPEKSSDVNPVAFASLELKTILDFISIPSNSKKKFTMQVIRPVSNDENISIDNKSTIDNSPSSLLKLKQGGNIDVKRKKSQWTF